MEKNKIKKSKSKSKTIILIILIFVILFLVYILFNRNFLDNKKVSKIDNESNKIEKCTEEDILKMLDNNDQIIVNSIDKISENKFIINARSFEAIVITEDEFMNMVKDSKITLDNVDYKYNQNINNDGFSSFGIIESKFENSKKYTVLKTNDGYSFQKYEEEFNMPLRKFNKEFQFEVDENYIFGIVRDDKLTRYKMSEIDSKYLDYNISDDYNVTIGRGNQGVGTEFVIEN